MAKLGGKLLAFAAIAGAVAAGVSYALQYKSFHKELEEDFHEFEDDFDDLDSDESGTPAKRNYVNITPKSTPEEDAELMAKVERAVDGAAANRPQNAAM